MVIVLVATRYQLLLEWLMSTTYQDITSIGIMKRHGPKVYLYVDTNLTFHEVSQIFKQTIKSNGGLMYIYEIYGIYNGMIDYNSYMSDTTKLSMKYYQSNHKDITKQDIEEYRKSHSL